MHISILVPKGVLCTVGMSMWSTVFSFTQSAPCAAKSQSPCICTLAQQPSSHGWCTIMCPPYTFPSTSGNILHCTCTHTHALRLAALPYLDVPIHPCFPLPGGLFTTTQP